jgi:PAS domain S-box-containing protein
MYQYKMEGFDKEWINTDASKRFAPYTKLPPGHYTFRVRGSNNDFKWNEAGVSVKVIITPPFWKTWWFQIFLGAAFVLVLTGGHLYRTKRLRDKLSEQKRVQDILRKSRDLAEFRRAEVEKLIAAISALLIAVDSDGEIFQWNETAEKFFGIRVNSTKGRFFVDLLKDCIEPGKLQEIIERGLHGEVNTIQNFEIPVILEKKGERLLLSTINPILDRSGQRLGFLLLAEDVTRRKEEERQRFLSQKLESLGQMAANIAHEIKNPLQYIGNNGCFISDSISDFSKFYNFINQCLTDIEQAGGKDVSERIKEKMIQYDIAYILDEVPRASDQIVSGVSRLSGIIQSMKEFAHPGRGVMEKADVHQLLESTLVMLRNKRKKMLDIQTDLCHTLPRVACYPGELSQVFLNLLINAADAIQEKGEPGVIKITTRIKNGKMEVSIADTGCGIPEAIKEDVFHLFFTTKGVDKGTGQGLSMAHKIITEKHKGKLFFESKVGVGTTFYIHLPIEGEN